MKLKQIIFGMAILILFTLLVSSIEPIQQEIVLFTGFYTEGKQLTAEYEEYDTGTVSWYGNWHRGRKMANGQKFNPNIVSFAHRKLPINSKIRVTNLENGKTVVGYVTDRGPYVEPRILDVSERGAKILGFKKEGLVQAKIEIFKSNPG